MLDSFNNVEGAVFVNLDISERINAEKDAVESKIRLNSLINTTQTITKKWSPSALLLVGVLMSSTICSLIIGNNELIMEELPQGSLHMLKVN